MRALMRLSLHASALYGTCCFLFMFTFAPPVSAEDQTMLVQSVLVEAKGPVPLQRLDAPPVLTPDEEAAIAAALSKLDLSAPPLRVAPGSVVAPPAVPATTAIDDARITTASAPGEAGVAPDADPGAFVLVRATAQNHGSNVLTSSSSQGAAAGPFAFTAGNSFASYSTDDGATFHYVDPRTQFGVIDGGFCCGQTVLYDRTRNLLIWGLQYSYSDTTGRGSHVIAMTHPSTTGFSGWTYWTMTPELFGLGTGMFFDSPDVVLGEDHLYFTANVYQHSGTFYRSLVWRAGLNDIDDGGSLSLRHYSTPDVFNFAFAQGSGSTMYWAGHLDTSTLRVYSMDEEGTIGAHDIAVSVWPKNIPYQCPGPDGLNWCGKTSNDGRMLTGWYADGVAAFLWNASQNATYTYPHVRVARVRVSDFVLLSEPHIWNPNYAWQYPAVGVNIHGDVGGSMYHGGGSVYPSLNAFIRDDYDPGWSMHVISSSARGATGWGDYFATRPHGTAGKTFVTTGQIRVADGTMRSVYAWFGRALYAPTLPGVTSPTVSSITSSTVWLGATVAHGGTGLIDRGVVYARTSVNPNPYIGGTGVTKLSLNPPGPGAFAVRASGLASGTAYTFRPFATNSLGTGYLEPASAFVTAVVPVPDGLSATAIMPNQVNVAWFASTWATSYDLERVGAGGAITAFSTTSTAYSDPTVIPGAAYVYRLRARDGAGNASAWTVPDPATTISFTDLPLVEHLTLVKTTHLNEARAAVNAFRAIASLPAVSWTNPSLTGVPVRAAHLTELRNALTPARGALGLPPLSYVDTIVPQMTPVKAIHLDQIRISLR
jgi:hypothetical protein